MEIMKKRIQLQYKKERMLLSDILPYEVPVTYSNRSLYNFLIEHDLHFKDSSFYWIDSNPVIDKTILLLLGLDLDCELNTIDSIFNNKIYKFVKETITPSELAAIPFTFAISHNEKDFRNLSIMHPRNQIVAINFYNNFKELILYNSSISKYSLRAPHSIAKCIFWDDKSRLQNFEENETTIEESQHEYKNLRSFFVYRKYSNIFKFYESELYHSCEKKYNFMAKLDISKCFDSIYTHTIAWSIFSKESVKDSMSKGHKKSLDKSFAGQFDTLMQNINYHETNGIIIGPELSRIFAEIILQRIDVSLNKSLESKGLKLGQNYEVYRYVDDYFIFYNNENTYDIIKYELQIFLKDYKLHLNTQKESIYSKPIITEITIAKQNIADLLTNEIKYKIKEEQIDDDKIIKKGFININARKLIVNFKTILKESNVEYKDILNYSLSVLERKCKSMIKDYLELRKEINPKTLISHNKHFIQASLSILEFLFFVYSVSPKVNTTIKLSRIVDIFIRIIKSDNFGSDSKHTIFKMIFDNVCFILNKNKASHYTQIETLYLLIVLKELGKEYWLNIENLNYYCGVENINGQYKFSFEPNYFTLTVLLFYMQNKKRYEPLKDAILSAILDKFHKNKGLYKKKSELVMLFFDLISCPFIKNEFKTKLYKFYGLEDELEIEEIQRNISKWFTNWGEFNLTKELDSKRSFDVY